MKNRQGLKVVFLCCLAVVVCTGCRGRLGKGSRSGVGDMGSDTLNLQDVELGMGERRFEDGARVTDVQFSNVQFAYDSYQIAETETGKIEAVAEYMSTSQDVRLVAEGHCDERGSREYNMSLGEHRALAVRAYLVGLGIDGARIQTRSFGEEQPLDPGHGEQAWLLNRRVEFALYR